MHNKLKYILLILKKSRLYRYSKYIIDKVLGRILEIALSTIFPFILTNVKKIGNIVSKIIKYLISKIKNSCIFNIRIEKNVLKKILILSTVVILIGIFCVFITPSVIRKVKNDMVYKDSIEKIDKCINEKEYDKALKLANNIIKSNIDKDGNVLKKQKKIKKLLKNESYNKYIDNARSDSIEITDEERIEAYTKAIDLKPEEENPYIEAASLYVQYNELEKAVNLLSSGVEACKEDNVEDSKIKIASLSKKIDEINLLMENGEYNDKYLEALNAYKKNNLEEVIIKYKECKLINQNDSRIYALMAKSYFKNKKYKDAIYVLSEGIDRLEKLGAKKEGTKLNIYYKYLVNLRNKFQRINEISGKYDDFYKRLLEACIEYNNGSMKKIKNIVCSYPISIIAACSNVTYYTTGKAYVERMNNGTCLAVYKNQYIYFGQWKNGKKHGKGYYFAIKKDGKKITAYMYSGMWENDYPNGYGKIIYECFNNDDLEYKTVTTGTFKRGYEEGSMQIVKTFEDKEYCMKYEVKNGTPVVLKENGKELKAADDTYIVGYYYDKENQKCEIVSIVSKTKKWNVSGLIY